MNDSIHIGLAQYAPIWLDKKATLDKVLRIIDEAHQQDVQLLVFGEGFVPGYPHWLSFLHASKFEDSTMKALHAHYISEAVCIEDGDLEGICRKAKEYTMSIYLGIIEKPKDRGGHSVYCSLVYVDQEGSIKSVHRKLQPTYEERLAWSHGDGHGLVTHPLEGFVVGGLNCWENWMPLPRAAMYAQGENIHVAVWPGSVRNTEDITPYIAKESRSYVVSVSSIMTKDRIPDSLPFAELLRNAAPEIMADGGSCICGPDGKWIITPKPNQEGLIVGKVELSKVLEERQNFDPAGHYSRPDVTKLIVNRKRQSTVQYEE